jgi:type VI protein secretion system component VasK
MKISHSNGLGTLPDFEQLKQKMQSAISKLQSTDPTLAKKLTSINKEVTTLTKSGVSTQDALKRAEKDNGSLSASETTELQSALGLGTGSINTITPSGTNDSLAALLSRLTDQSSGTSAELTNNYANPATGENQGSLLGQLLAHRYNASGNQTLSAPVSPLGPNGLSV